MKTRYRLGKEGLFRKEVLILQVWASWPAVPDSFGGDERMAGEGWRDATVEDLHLFASATEQGGRRRIEELERQLSSTKEWFAQQLKEQLDADDLATLREEYEALAAMEPKT